MTKHNTPALRFSGFDGEWDIVRMDDVTEVNPSADIPNLFNYVDLASVLGTGLANYCPYSKGKAPSRAQRVAQVGDIFYQTVRPYQKNNYHFNFRSDRAFVFSTGYAQIRPKINSSYVFTAVQRDEFLTQVLNRCTGTSYPAIAPSQIGEITLSFPESRKEQRAIGELFADLDALIEQHRAKHKNLQRTKTALMQKMFPQDGHTQPDLRLDGFEGAWDSRTIVSMAEVVTGTTPPTQNARNYGAHIPFLGPADLEPAREITVGKKYLSKQGLQLAREIPPGATLLVCIGSIGKVGQCSIPVTTNQQINAVIPNDSRVNDFLFTRIESAAADIIASSSTQTMPIISKSKLESVPLDCPPTLEEQRAIGAVFTKLDTLISAESQFIEKLKQTKTALLQKMFV